MPKVTFIIDGEPTVVEFEHGKLPYSHHGKPESFLDVAKNLGVPLEHAEADFAARQLIEARNDADAVMLATEKSLRSQNLRDIEATELAPGERQKIESVLAGLKMVMNSSDRETIQKWTKALNDATQHLAEIMMNRSVREALSGKNVNEM